VSYTYIRMLSIPLGANRRLCLSTVWATLSATSQDDDVNPARVGAVALRLVEDQDVLAASFTGFGGAMPPKMDDSLIEAAAIKADELQECLNDSDAQTAPTPEPEVEASTPEPQEEEPKAVAPVEDWMVPDVDPYDQMLREADDPRYDPE